MRADLHLTVQRATRLAGLPRDAQLRRWVAAALAGARRRRAAELTLRLVNRAEGQRLNRRWRSQHHATNVLSFPADLPAGLRSPLLGDLVVCVPVVRREALAQGKRPEAHWAHLVVHGTLHLLGYDHAIAAQARRMESLEVAILEKLGYKNPYITPGI
ncbi:MAG: rRNA maturation RNase YbeY [Gammaproteobacteria bacterium]